MFQRNRLKPLVSEKSYARFEILTAVVKMNTIFSDIMPGCRLKIMFPAGFLLGLLINHEDGVTCSSKALVDFEGTTWYYIAEYGTL